MPRFQLRTRPTRTSPVLLVALGALAGIAVGLLMADRVGGLDGLRQRAARPRVRVRDDGTEPDDPPATARAEAPVQASATEGAQTRHPAPAAPPRNEPTHDELEARVLEAFRNDPVLEARAIDIGAVGLGTIELTGWVEGSGEIAHALTIARGVPGVRTVVDQLAVRGLGATRSHRTAQYEAVQRD